MITWVLEEDVFATGNSEMKSAAASAGHEVASWRDEWWSTGKFPTFLHERVLFHGSLENASRIHAEVPWAPGAYCDVDAFRCSNWYPEAEEWLVHKRWQVAQLDQFIDDPSEALAALGASDEFFVRPDSPLKPFSGRVLTRDRISLEAVDHGFYFEDETISIVLAPVTSISREWRLVVANQVVVAGCEYEARDRTPTGILRPGSVIDFGQEIAAALPPPDPVHVLDVCEVNSELKLLELNPFSGADLYACERASVVAAVEEILR